MRSVILLVFGVGAVSGSLQNVLDTCNKLQLDFQSEMQHLNIQLAQHQKQTASQSQNIQQGIDSAERRKAEAANKKTSCSSSLESSKRKVKELVGRIDFLNIDIDVAKQYIHDIKSSCSLNQGELDSLVKNLKNAQATLVARKVNAFAEVSSMVEAISGDMPEAHASIRDSPIGNLINVVQTLLDDATQQQENMKKQCTSSRQSYELLIKDLVAELESKNAEQVSEKKITGEAQLCVGDAGSELEDAQTEIISGIHQLKEAKLISKNLEDGTKAQIFQLNQSIHALAQVQQALRNVDSMSQIPLSFNSVSFMQFHSTLSDSVSALVAKRATELRSSTLSTLATKLLHSSDNFGSVKTVIGDLINKLEKEASHDITRSAQCEKEQNANKAKRASITGEKDALVSKQFESSAAVQLGTEQLKSAQKKLSESKSQQATAVEQLRQDKLEYQKTISSTKQNIKVFDECLKIIEPLKSKFEILSPMFVSLKKDHQELLSRAQEEQATALQSHEQITKTNNLEVQKYSKVAARAKQKLSEDKALVESTKVKLDDISRKLADFEKVEAGTKSQCNGILSPEEKISKKKAELETLKQVQEILSF